MAKSFRRQADLHKLFQQANKASTMTAHACPENAFAEAGGRQSSAVLVIRLAGLLRGLAKRSPEGQ
ncbi:hypothetical protein [Bradyrhizobium sp. USDA 3458]|uniref:hypothetical protein n=1 Tax=Bradyrhizobium sp. USDA 3458 TaxID=2591461 RepID=UPI001143E0A8|nr:hypothetical protein [Bradyrhizobium sp. USDA 3458]